MAVNASMDILSMLSDAIHTYGQKFMQELLLHKSKIALDSPAHLILCVSYAAQTCTLPIDDIENKYFYSLNASDGNCSPYMNESQGVYTWNAGDSCNFKCAGGYYSANPNDNAIPFQCSADLNRTSPLGSPTTLTPCESTCFEKQLIMSVRKRNVAMRLRGIFRTHFRFQYRAMDCNA